MKVLVQGWKNYPHSYSIVNVFQMLYLSRISGVILYFQELPPFRSELKTIELKGTLLTEEEVEELNTSLIPYDKSIEIDVIYRISYPYDLSLPLKRGIPTCLFYTSEFMMLKDEFFVGNSTVDRFITYCKELALCPVTPSEWSANALRAHSFEPIIIPHGVDTNKYFPTDNNLRNDLGISKDATVYLNIGAMTANKGIALLIKSFYNITFVNDNSYLILKGLGDIYTSKEYVDKAIESLKSANLVDLKRWANVEKKIIFINETLDYCTMNLLYNTATAYVSPYLAEGFNLPALEAIACGIPLICSDHGPTCDFTLSEFCLKPKTSILKPNHSEERFLSVDDLDLENCMMQVSKDKEFCSRARLLGPAYVKKNFSWEMVAEKMVGLFSFLIPKFDVEHIVDSGKYTVIRP